MGGTAASAVVAGVACLVWILQVLVRIWRARGPRPRAAAGAQEWQSLPPAIVSLLAGNGILPETAAAATLVDLADRRYVDIEEVGPELSLVRLRRPEQPERSYERLVLDHVRSLAVEGVVATDALAEGSRKLTEWVTEYDAAVVKEARELGLTAKAGGVGSGMSVTGLVAGALIGLVVDLVAMPRLGGEPQGALVPPVIVTWIAVMTCCDRWLGGERLTRKGRQVAAGCLALEQHLKGIHGIRRSPAAAVTIWGRQFACAVGLGITVAAASLPLVRSPEAGHAWSGHGGLWHRVSIRYPGQSKILGAVFVLLVAVGWLAVTFGVTIWYALRPPGEDELPSFAVSMIMLPGGGFVMVLVLACIALPLSAVTRSRWRAQASAARPEVVVEGKIVRLQPASYDGRYIYVAIDHGQRRIDAHRMVGTMAEQLREGQLVRASCSRNGFIVRIDEGCAGPS